MKREILFKAKSIHDKTWVQGFLTKKGTYQGQFYIEFPYGEGGFIDWSSVPVYRETVCQFTGLIDKEGNKIFEGDIIKNIQSDENEVFYWGNGFHYRNNHAEAISLDDLWNPYKNEMLGVDINQTEHEIIGNIHD